MKRYENVEGLGFYRVENPKLVDLCVVPLRCTLGSHCCLVCSPGHGPEGSNGVLAARSGGQIMPFKLRKPRAAGVKKTGAQCLFAAFLLRFFRYILSVQFFTCHRVPKSPNLRFDVP
jgi:hypothetical protein